MVRGIRSRRSAIASWIGVGAVGLGTVTALLSVLADPARRARARTAAARMTESARQAGDRLQAAHLRDAPRSALERPGVLGSVLLARALLGRGILRIPFGLLGLSTLARAASGSTRGRAVLDSATRGLRGSAAALRNARLRAEGGAAGPAILGPDAKPG